LLEICVDVLQAKAKTSKLFLDGRPILHHLGHVLAFGFRQLIVNGLLVIIVVRERRVDIGQLDA
jgi:hypothetical protein